MAETEFADSQIIVENVGFLDNCFDFSFQIQNTLEVVQEYVSEEEKKPKHIRDNLNKKVNSTVRNSSAIIDASIYNETKITHSSQSQKQLMNKNLKEWGLPSEIAKKYEQKGITEMFEWQVTCLGNAKVLLDCCNLVYSAPTSAGKTLVAEILTIKTVLERQKKVIIILPFVSIVREKMFYLQDILSSSGIRVEGFMGSQSPPGGLQAVHVAICTIEKANSLINRLLDDGNISDLGAVIVDELHLLGDPHRGYILELLLTKVKYVTSKMEGVQIQIVGMSATLPNLEVLATWLDAELFVTQFRPIPLDEFCLVNNKYYDKQGNFVSTIKYSTSVAESDNVLKICLETIKEGCSVLIFCMTKNRCENLAQNIASSFFKLGCSGNEIGVILRHQLKTENIAEVLEQLKNCPVGLDQVLKNTISFGVAYHHAGLTFDERDIIEGAFKSGAIRVLVATSTLSSGVNLPARKVIIRTPVFQRQPINILTYKQMIGRAGRMGRDTKGESILVCTENEKKIGFELMMGALDPVESCIESEDKYMRAILEMIASQVACTKAELDLYSQCTLLYTQQRITPSQNILLQNTLEELKKFELVRLQNEGDDILYVATPLGKACLSSSMAPNDGLSLFCELQKARQCLVLETDLHLIYLVTPYSVSSQWADIDWLHLLTLWESLTKAMKRVGELVGVQESFIIRCLRGGNKSNNAYNKLNIHKRFYTALALQDLVNEVPLSEVASKFQCARGFLQSLQQSAATFAGMVTAFCHQLGWKNMEMLISQFQDRLHFGIHSELLELMKLPSLNGMRARSLFDAGFETITSIATAEPNVIENALYKALPFQSEKEREGDDSDDTRKRNKMKNIWITGCCGMTTMEAAENLISEARRFLEHDIGGAIKWEHKNANTNTDHNKSSTQHTDVYNKEIETNKSTASEVSLQLNVNKTTKNETTVENDNAEEINKSKTDTSTKITEDDIDSDCLLDSPASGNLYLSAKSKSDITISNRNNVTSINKSKSMNSAIYTQNKLSNDVKDAKKESAAVKSSPIISDLVSSYKINQDDDIIWDTMNFTDIPIENITKLRTSEKMFSPDISFGETEDKLEKANTELLSSKGTPKNNSLFSDGDNSNLFEESLPLDTIPTKLIEDCDVVDQTPKIDIQDETLNHVQINTESMLNAFKSTIIDVEDDENIKLIYEEDKMCNDVNDDVIGNTQNVEETCVKNHFISPLKRNADNANEKNPGRQPAKKLKMGHQLQETSTIDQKQNQSCICRNKFSIQIKDTNLKCAVLKGRDINLNLHIIEKVANAAIFFDTNNKTLLSNEPIGSNIVRNQPKLTIKHTEEKQAEIPLIKSIAICTDEDNCIFIDVNSLNGDYSLLRNKLRNWFLKIELHLKALCLKNTYKYVKQFFDADIAGSCTDVSLSEWLIDSDEKISSIAFLMKKYCELDLSTTSFRIGNRVKKFKNLDAIEEMCVKAWCVRRIACIQSSHLLKLYHNIQNIIDIELQIAKILASCEYYGVTVDKALASRLLIDVKNSQEALQKKAYQLCGYHFNFNSSKDVAKVLGIYRGRKVSTKKSVLCSHNSPVSSIVIYWRKLNSILTKTLYPLTERACIYSEGNRITPSYTMHTCSGRISMHEPNLQSVPRTFTIPLSYLSDESTEEIVEFNCRNIFRASPGHVLVSADYCQLELRILTHYCQDQVLVGIMRAGVDVFRAVAASWGQVAEEQVDDDLRQKAKQLCYGIIYGMGNKTLSQTLDVSEMEAAVFMDSFHKTYPAIKVYTQRVVEDCKRNGYIETLKKRRRYLPDINSGVASKRSAAERQAINTTIQGSAADIAKSAMCAIDTRTSTHTHKPRLILQMHDELIYEVPETSKAWFEKVLKEVMENSVTLRVPLPVKVKSGYTWGTLEEIKV
ncbi:DNA polymerase theta [Leguminivora glycinivorella]|uniref:DNA polymerase theta n=1 Tax=Leguminivora glycinivorella TaxID=1035111 RepID=UPI0020103BDB|nr:DNA polymerase theta [Leguminivora glycinivorella]